MNPIKKLKALTLPWPGSDPFLFCMHHVDQYPAGDANMAPKASLAGRSIGQDFANKDGWNMYHGDTVPGFPQHPHRGFETVTFVREGLIDHADSLKASARFGQGDVQWITAGKGISHSEMFPLIEADKGNPTELFQIWVNLPKAKKLVDPFFSMLWSESIPKVKLKDDTGREIEVTLVAGKLNDISAPPPPPNSYASMPESDLAIWNIKLAPLAKWTLPKAKTGTNRNLYFYRGENLQMDGTMVRGQQALELVSDVDVVIENGLEESELLMLQAKPINEPVAQHGPFVMNTQAELQQAFDEYRRTEFGGWPWPKDDPVFDRSEKRFARYPDGKIEKKN